MRDNAPTVLVTEKGRKTDAVRRIPAITLLVETLWRGEISAQRSVITLSFPHQQDGSNG